MDNLISNTSVSDFLTDCGAVQELMERYIGKQEHLLTIVKKRNVQWFGHVIRWNESFANTILQGWVKKERKTSKVMG